MSGWRPTSTSSTCCRPTPPTWPSSSSRCRRAKPLSSWRPSSSPSSTTAPTSARSTCCSSSSGPPWKRRLSESGECWLLVLLSSLLAFPWRGRGVPIAHIVLWGRELGIKKTCAEKEPRSSPSLKGCLICWWGLCSTDESRV